MKASSRSAAQWVALPIATVFVMVFTAIMPMPDNVIEQFPVIRNAADVFTGLRGALVACAMLTTACVIAPRHRRTVVSITYLFGAFLAWQVLGDWYFPESHPRAYEPSKLPLTTTLIAGLLYSLALWRSLTPARVPAPEIRASR